MSEKRNKYDTDPLDQEFARRTEQLFNESPGAAASTSDVSRERPTERIQDARVGHTAPPPPLPPASFYDEQTRRLGDAPPAGSYPSVFVPPTYQPPAAPTHVPYEPSGAATRHFAGGAATSPYAARPSQSQGKPTKRALPGLGLPENVAMVLPYAPFYIGLAAALVELVLVPRAEYRARFHASQGLALQLAILAGAVLFWGVEAVTGSGIGGGLFALAANIFLVVSMIRVWQGEPHRLAPLEDLTSQINQRFDPRKK